MFQNKKLIRVGTCLLIATVLALTSHRYISEWVQPLLDSMTQGLQQQPYSAYIISAAYATAFITVGLVVFLYYHTQHLIPIKSNFLKALLIACILLELKGFLIRQPAMDVLVNYSFGMKGLQPFLFSGLNIMDKWVSNLLVALAVVYLCPKKYEAKEV